MYLFAPPDSIPTPAGVCKTAAVDPSRQFGLFAVDAAGGSAEVGERPGQTDLPGLRVPVRGPAPKAAPARDEPGQMYLSAAR